MFINHFIHVRVWLDLQPIPGTRLILLTDPIDGWMDGWKLVFQLMKHYFYPSRCGWVLPTEWWLPARVCEHIWKLHLSVPQWIHFTRQQAWLQGRYTFTHFFLTCKSIHFPPPVQQSVQLIMRAFLKATNNSPQPEVVQHAWVGWMK